MRRFQVFSPSSWILLQAHLGISEIYSCMNDQEVLYLTEHIRNVAESFGSKILDTENFLIR